MISRTGGQSARPGLGQALRALLLGALVVPWVAGAASSEASERAASVAQAYPGVITGALSSAALGELPPGVLLRSDATEVTQQRLDDVVAKSPEALREQLRKNALHLLDELATREHLLAAARQAAARQGADVKGKSDAEIVEAYTQQAVAAITVTEPEIARFYESHPGMFGGDSLRRVRDRLAQFLLKTKRQEALDEHVRGLGRAFHAVVAAAWVREHVALARDNPVDAARFSGRPSLVDFGAETCRPCKKMAPILEDLRTKYVGKLNVVFVHALKELVLATRHGVGEIPVQIFFDADGKEVFRHTGFFSQREIEAKLREMGVQ